jgi:Pyruvate/2-oxoacid:ferredoxin oxidoreductase delta subunit
VRVPGSEFRIAAGCIVSALGETSDLDFLPEEFRPSIHREGPFAAGSGAIFAAGDMVSGDGSVAAAIGSGCRAADSVHRYLTEQSSAGDIKMPWSHWNRPFNPDLLADADSMHREWFLPASPPAIRREPLDVRKSSFREIVDGFLEEEALAEARRCLSCGTCNGCMNCYAFCPDVTVRRSLRGDFEIDDDHCKGCGICVEECPRGAVTLEGVAS